MSDPDNHRCRSGENCVNADTKETDADGRTIRRGALVVDGPLCGGCNYRLQRAVGYMAKDWLRLRAHLGQTASADLNDRVGGTREPAIPLNTQVEALMSRLVELAERATAMVGKPTDRSRGRSDQRDAQAIDQAVQNLLPRIDKLLAAPATDTLVWSRIPTGDDEWNPTGQLGQPRVVAKVSGLDVAADIVKASRRVGQLLGKDRLRHHYAMPCPAMDKRGRYCGAMTVGRDDGQARVNCSTCGASWTEAEYDFLSGLVLDEIQLREENDMLRYLLAEAYWRLDSLQIRSDALAAEWDALVQTIQDNPAQAVEIVNVIRQALSGVLTDGAEPHQRPEDRVTAAPKAKR
ncbi:hypothetical protein [Mycolicibacterium fortuitum]|uniref:hypothetical protein n=1 Tax=Mycolicibacterium fortuitum TaxID=1766 RepID=UPI00116221B7|nr:hypothetical protein [Mycolicibacterium fortuitum]QDF19382.1 hypothetical protein SEA_CRACKLEWINK_96 [Mycobacterium phage Cracklewink]UBV14837.1 hypothetical protein H8Z57_29780 [Mycolicibacterium fortuitum]